MTKILSSPTACPVISASPAPRVASSPTPTARRLWTMVVAALVMAVAFVATGSAQTAHLLGQVSTFGSGFSNPHGIVTDASGNIYVADYGSGNVYKETYASATGTYTQTVLFSGFDHAEYLTFDAAGNFFIDSATHVYKETLSGGTYTQSVVGSCSVCGGVAVDSGGNLFVADGGTGALYKLDAGTYAQTTIATGLNNPYRVTIDAAGNLYVANVLGNTLFKETLSGGVYSQSTAVNVNHPYGITVDPAGNLFFGSNNSVFDEAIFSGGTYTTRLFYPYPEQDATLDAKGDFYLISFFYSNGTKLTAAPDLGSVPLKTTSAPISISFMFDSAGTLGSKLVLTQGALGLDFNDAGTGTCTSGTSYNAGDTCTIDVTFTPGAPGLRRGAAQLTDGSGNVLASAYISGTGIGPQAGFLPGTLSPVVSVSSPWGVAVDASDNLYYTSNVGAGHVYKRTPGGVNSTYPQFYGPVGVTVDGAGSLYYVSSASAGTVPLEKVARGSNTPIHFSYNSTGQLQSSLASDRAGNLYVPGPAGVTRLAAGNFAQTSFGSGTVTTLTLDAAGNVYTGKNDGTISVITPDHVETQLVSTGLNLIVGLAVDSAGNLYAASYFSAKVIRYSAGTYAATTVASGFGASGLAFNNAGDLYIGDASNNRILKLTLSSSPGLSFATPTPVGSTDSTDGFKTVFLANSGNASLVISPPGSGTNPSISSGFTLGNGSTCPQLSSNSSFATLVPGASCTDLVSFAPVAAGANSGSLTFTDNNLNVLGSAQSVPLSGTATKASQSISFPQPPTPIAYFSGESVTLAATTTSGLAVIYSVSGPATLSGSTLTYTGGGTVTVTASQPGDSNHFAAAPVQHVVTVNVVPTAYTSPATNVNASSATQSISLVFTTATTLNSNPATAIQVLTQGASSLDFIYHSGGTCAAGASYSPGDTCTVNVSFAPKAPGQRLGAAVAYNSNSNPIATSFLGGVGTSGLGVFSNGTQSVFATVGDAGQNGLTLDAAGNVFYTNLNTGTLNRIAAGTNVSTQIANGINGASGVAVDGAGNVFYAAYSGNSVYELVGGTGSPVTVATVSLPEGLAVDAAGNLYVAASGSNVVSEFAAATFAPVANFGTGLDHPQALVLDNANNIFLTDRGNGRVVKIPTDGTAQTVVTTGLNFPVGLAMDPAGNLYVANTGSNNVLRIPAGTAAQVQLGAGFSTPKYVALDGLGNLLVADTGNNNIAILSRTKSTFDFGKIAIGHTSAVTSLLIENDGNAPLTISGVSTTGNFSAQAGSPVCPGQLAVAAGCGVGVQFGPQSAGPLSGSVTISDDSLNLGGSFLKASLLGIGAPPDPYIASAAIDFGNQPNGSTSNFYTVTFNNTSGWPIILDSITLTDAVNFKQTNNCPAVVPAYTNCNIQVSFSPSGTGPFNGLLQFTDDTLNSPQSVTLTGVGTSSSPTVLVSPTDITFADQMAGTTGNSWTVTVSNTSPYTLAISNISLTNNQDFTLTSGCGATLAGNTTCNLLVRSTPHAVGGTTGSIVINDNATPNPVQTVTLHGNGTSNTPTVLVSPTDITFADQMVGTTGNSWTVTINNTSSVPLTLSSISLNNTQDFVLANGCGATLAANSTCNLQVSMKPNATGARTGSLVIIDNANPGTQTVTLHGNGTSNAPTVVVSPSNVSFADQVAGTTSNPWTVNVSNTSGVPLVFTSISLSNTASFGLVNHCSSTLPAYSSCTLLVTFNPQGAASTSGDIILVDNAATPTQQVHLNGTGLSNLPTAFVSPGSVSFSNQPVGSTSNVYTATLNNTSDSPLNISNIAVLNPVFSVTSTCGSVLAAHSTCNLFLKFTPSGVGQHMGTLTVTDNTQAGSEIVPLSGFGQAPGVNVQLAPGSVDFSNQAVGTTGSPWTVNFSNMGGTDVAIGSIILSDTANFSQITTCGSTLAAYSSCDILVSFKPQSATTFHAGLYVTSNGNPNVLSVPLNGTGTQAPDYTLSVNPSSLTLSAGQTGTATFTFTPVGGYVGTVFFACTGLPVGTTCSFNPVSVTANGTNTIQTSQLTVTTTGAYSGPVGISQNRTSAGSLLATFLFLPGLMFGGLLAWRRKSLTAGMRGLLLLLLTASVAAGMSGCSSFSHFTPVGSNVVTVSGSASATGGASASGGSTAHLAHFTLTIKN